MSQSLILPDDFYHYPRHAERVGSALLVTFAVPYPCEAVTIRIGGPPDYMVMARLASSLVWCPLSRDCETGFVRVLAEMRGEVEVVRHRRTIEQPDGQVLCPALFVPGLKHSLRGDLSALRYFWKTPAAVWQQVENFHPASRLPLLRLLARCPEAAQLVVINPALAVLLATANTPRATYSLPGLLQCKQVDIYRAVAFAAVDTGIVRSLASMAPGICTLGHIAILQRAWMKRPFARLLPHLRINRVLLRVFDSPGISPVLSARLLSAISRASADELEEVTASWETFCEMVGLGFGKRQPLEMLSDISQWNRSLEHMPARSDLPVPAPPFSGQRGVIEPLTDAPGLIEEGRVQRNCVGTLALQRHLIQTHACVYRVLSPERATLLILPRGSWRGRELEISQLRGYKNANVSPETTAFVQEWLSVANKTNHQAPAPLVA